MFSCGVEDVLAPLRRLKRIHGIENDDIILEPGGFVQIDANCERMKKDRAAIADAQVGTFDRVVNYIVIFERKPWHRPHAMAYLE